jgi:hypothetical protein
VQNSSQRTGKKKYLLVGGLILGAALLGGGVYASTSITLNGGTSGVVNLGTGVASVNACNSSATIGTQTYFNPSYNAFMLGTVSLSNINDTNCAGKTIQMAFVANGTTYNATWAVPTSGGSTNDTYYYGVSPSSGYQYATLATPGLNVGATQAISSIAIAVQ